MDVYKCHGFNFKIYDKISLYPSSMVKLIPFGNHIYFDGDLYSIRDLIFDCNINDINKRPYGFFNVEVVAPDNLDYPILQTKFLTKDGLRTVAPLGSWKGVYSSTEIYNAIDNFGYKFKINSGVLFPRTVLFEDFINHFYEMKANSTKDNPRYYIAKLMMNSLYGKMGQSYLLEKHFIVQGSELTNLIQNKSLEISSILELDTDVDNPMALVSFLNKNLFNVPKSYKGSISIASEISADARVSMSLIIKYCIENGYIIYYMDTDSLVLDRALPDYFVSNNELGKIKLEHKIEA